jgi:hypothetical protein
MRIGIFPNPNFVSSQEVEQQENVGSTPAETIQNNSSPTPQSEVADSVSRSSNSSFQRAELGMTGLALQAQLLSMPLPNLELKQNILPAQIPPEELSQAISDNSGIDGLQAVEPPVVQTKPNVDWDTIAFIKNEMGKTDPDETAMKNALMKLDSNDLSATLNALAERGNPSDLELILNQFSKAGVFRELTPVFNRLTQNLPVNTLAKKPLDQIFSSLRSSPDSDTIARQFLQDNRGSGNLAKLEPQTVNSIYACLQKRETLANNLYTRLLAEETKTEPGKIPSPDELLAKAMNGSEPMDNTISEAMKNFPEWGLNKANEFLKQGNFAAFVKCAQPMGGFLAEFCKLGNAEAIVSESLREAGKMDPAKGRAFLIRELVNGLGDKAVETLGNFSPMLLLDMKGILQNAPPYRASMYSQAEYYAQPILENVIEPALNFANNKRANLNEPLKDSSTFNPY